MFCHDAGSGGSLTIDAPTEYVPGEALQIVITSDDGDGTSNDQGFELAVVDAATGMQHQGTLTLGTGTEFASGDDDYVTHSSAGNQWTVNWTPPGTDVGAVRIYAAGASYSSPVYTATHTIDPATMPVELTLFEAVADGRDAVLRWETATETNNAGFQVQHRAPEAEALWVPLGFVEGAGTTLVPQPYRYRTAALAPGVHRFRLKQVDADGTFEYSGEVELEVEMPHTLALDQNYPNPFNPATRISFTVPAEAQTTLIVYNPLGQAVATLYDGVARAGQLYTATFEADALPSGAYLYTLSSGGRQLTHTMMLTK
jgi:hypothetical protein